MKNLVIAVLVVAVLGLIGYLALAGGVSFGAASGYAHYQKESFLQGLAAGARDAFSINNTGKTVTVGTTNTATSTLIVGCIQFYATSTATVQKFQASTTPGTMYSQYGRCPNL